MWASSVYTWVSRVRSWDEHSVIWSWSGNPAAEAKTSSAGQLPSPYTGGCQEWKGHWAPSTVAQQRLHFITSKTFIGKRDKPIFICSDLETCPPPPSHPTDADLWPVPSINLFFFLLFLDTKRLCA